MTYMDELYEHLSDYFGLPPGSKIVELDQECYYTEGCPTCGGDYEFSVFVEYKDKDGVRQYAHRDGKLSDFLNYLNT